MKKHNNLYLLTQDKNDGYDTYDSVVVCAPDEETARHIHPGVGYLTPDNWEEYTSRGSPYESYEAFVEYQWNNENSGWVTNPEDVTVKRIGVADDNIKPGIIVASFNAA